MSSAPLRCLALLAFCAGCLLAHPLAVAQSKPAEGPPLWEIGAFGLGVSQQAYPGSDEQVGRAIALPYLLYRGRVLRADGDTAGLRALKTQRYELDIGFAGSFGAGSNEIEARRGMAKLGTLVEAGPRLKVRLGEAAGGRWRLELPVRGVFDLSDDFRHRGMAFEPELVFERQARGGWRYSSSVGAIVADRRLADHFYGVRLSEATPTRRFYTADSGLVAWRLSTSASYSLNRDWRLFGYLRLDSVSGAANANSPLVRRDTGATVGLGLSYAWMRSEARAAD